MMKAFKHSTKQVAEIVNNLKTTAIDSNELIK